MLFLVVFICIFGAASSQGVGADRKKEKPNTTEELEELYRKYEVSSDDRILVDYSECPTRDKILLPEEIEWALFLFSDRISSEVAIPQPLYDQWQCKINERDEFDRVLGETVGGNNLGIALERAGDIDGAVACYEKNIALGYPATHAFERLRIIYKRRRDVVNELRVLRAGVAVFSAANDTRMASALRENPQYEKEIMAARLDPKNGTRRDPLGNLLVSLISEEAKYRMRISVLLKNNPELK